MNMRKTRIVALVVTLTFVVASCAAPNGRGPDGRLAAETFEASRAFQRLLVLQGMSEDAASKHVLVGNYTHAWSRGQILLAVVRRDILVRVDTRGYDRCRP